MQEEKRFSVRFPLDLLADMKQYAREDKRSINAEIVWALDEFRRKRESEQIMEEQPTLLEQTQSIRERYQRGEITPAEAKNLIKPYYDEYVKIANEKAKAAGMRAPKMSLEKFLSRRSDLRYAAQQRASGQREQL